MSVSERVLWARIRGNQLGFAFRRQFAIGAYVLDFFCPEAKLCIEVDGPQHEQTRERDAARDAFLDSKGILTLRVPSIILFEHDSPEFSRFLDLIRSTCEERTGRKAWDR
jgi:very-short-patch-repair endonuclease